MCPIWSANSLIRITVTSQNRVVLVSYTSNTVFEKSSFSFFLVKSWQLPACSMFQLFISNRPFKSLVTYSQFSIFPPIFFFILFLVSLIHASNVSLLFNLGFTYIFRFNLLLYLGCSLPHCTLPCPKWNYVLVKLPRRWAPQEERLLLTSIPWHGASHRRCLASICCCCFTLKQLGLALICLWLVFCISVSFVLSIWIP